MITMNKAGLEQDLKSLSMINTQVITVIMVNKSVRLLKTMLLVQPLVISLNQVLKLIVHLILKMLQSQLTHMDTVRKHKNM